MESKYLPKFQKMQHADIPLRGNRLIVEVMPKEEMKSAGGLVLKTSLDDHRNQTEMNRPTLCVVLAKGDGYVNESSGELEPLAEEVGNVAMVSHYGLKILPDFPLLHEYTKDTMALTRDTEIHILWPSIEAMQEAKKKLNG
jgi:co-chaperonin GroES (HSP10)